MKSQEFCIPQNSFGVVLMQFFYTIAGKAGNYFSMVLQFPVPKPWVKTRFGMIWEGIAVPKQIIGQTYQNCLDLWHCLTPTTWNKKNYTKIHRFLEDTFPTAHFCLASPWHQRHRPGPCDAVLPSPVSAVPAARHRAPPGGGCVRPRFRPAAPRCYRPGVPKWGPHDCHDVIMMLSHGLYRWATRIKDNKGVSVYIRHIPSIWS